MIKTFRGRLANGGKHAIRLSTNDGLTGYKIVKFQIMSDNPGTTSNELVSKIFTVNPSSAVDGEVNFDDPTLLAVATYQDDSGVGAGPNTNIIWDNLIVNQDLYITGIDMAGSALTNYHIEMEKVKLDLNEATVATLKDMRGRE